MPATARAAASRARAGRLVRRVCRRLIRPTAPSSRPLIDQNRHRAQHERDADDVVERLPRLELDQHLSPEGDRAADQALRAQAVGAADAVRGQQAEREEAEVEQRREDVAVVGEQRDRMQDLRVRRVVGGEEDRVEVVDDGEVAAVREPDRLRHVVPEGVGAVHAPGEASERRHHPGGGDRSARRGGEPDRHACRRGRGRRGGGARAPARVDAPADEQADPGERDAGDEHRHLAVGPERPQNLCEPDQRRDPEHRLGQARRGAAPPGEDRGPNPPGRKCNRPQHHRQNQGADQVGAEVERALGGRGDRERRGHAPPAAAPRRVRRPAARGSGRMPSPGRPSSARGRGSRRTPRPRPPCRPCERPVRRRRRPRAS